MNERQEERGAAPCRRTNRRDRPCEMGFSTLDDPCFLDRAACEGALGRRSPPGPWAGLYVAGTLAALAAPAVAVVGSRAPSRPGRRLAFRLAADLAAAGACIVSGLALGIDAAAHEGALAAGAPTIGVLGGGHRQFFPPANRALAERMVAGGGAVVSPYAPGHPAYPGQFLARNGLVAALCDAVVVVEAAARSGALNTAAWAAERGVPVLAVPGDVDRAKVAGCLTLIRDGATLVRDAADVLAALPAGCCVPAPRPAAGPPGVPATGLGAALLALLSDGERHVDRLIEQSAAPAHEVMAALAELELDGYVAVDGAVAARSPAAASARRARHPTRR